MSKDYRQSPVKTGWYVMWHPHLCIDGKLVKISSQSIDLDPDDNWYYFPIDGFDRCFKGWHCDCGAVFSAIGECFNCGAKFDKKP